MEPTARLRDAPQERTTQANGRPSQAAALPGRWETESADRPINPLAPDDGRYVTKAEYWARWYENPYLDVSYEWNNGILEAKPLSTPPQLDLYGWFLTLLLHYEQSHPIARLLYLETGFNLTMPDPAELSGMREAVRKPDIGVILYTNPVLWKLTERAYRGICDMCVESVSDSTLAEARRDTEEKKRDYALAGVREYFILDPDDRYMRFYRLGAAGRYAEIQSDVEGVIRSEVLPGFQFRRRDLLRLPEIKDLALDEVYAGYVLPEYQAAVAASQKAEEQATLEGQRADTETQRADTETQRADTETQRADTETQRADTEAQRADTETQRADTEAQRADTEAAARRVAEERAQALEAELARLRQQRS